jgi:hypothetical protein
MGTLVDINALPQACLFGRIEFPAFVVRPLTLQVQPRPMQPPALGQLCMRPCSRNEVLGIANERDQRPGVPALSKHITPRVT